MTPYDATQAALGIGALVSARRKALNLTQADLADLSGVSVRYLSSLENGKPTARLDGVLAVLNALGVEFIGGTR